MPGNPAWAPDSVLACFGLGLMSKPMVVTLPCVLLLLDFWALNRFEPKPVSDGKPPTAFDAKAFVRTAAVLIGEKFPSLLHWRWVVTTIFAQKAGGVLAPVSGLSFQVRAANALVSYLEYPEHHLLAGWFWPISIPIPLTCRWPRCSSRPWCW